MFKDKLFFFGAQEWVDYFQVSTEHRHGADAGDAARRFQRAARRRIRSSARPQIIRDPLTGQPFPGQHHSDGAPVTERHGIMELYPEPTPGFQQGTANAIFNSENPQDQRKDSIRLDYRLNNNNQFMFRFSAIELGGDRRVPRNLPVRPHRLGAAESRRENFNWTSTIKSNLINEFNYTHSLDEVFISVFTESGLHKREPRPGINYPYIFPVGKEIEDKIPTVNVDRTSPASTAVRIRRPRRGRSHVLEHHHLVKRPPHLQGRRGVRVLRRGRLRPDQRQRHPRRHQQPERPVRVHATAGSGALRASRMADMALGVFTRLRRARAARVHEVAGAGDRHLHPGFVEADAPT